MSLKLLGKKKVSDLQSILFCWITLAKETKRPTKYQLTYQGKFAVSRWLCRAVQVEHFCSRMLLVENISVTLSQNIYQATKPKQKLQCSLQLMCDHCYGIFVILVHHAQSYDTHVPVTIISQCPSLGTRIKFSCRQMFLLFILCAAWGNSCVGKIMYTENLTEKMQYWNLNAG